MNDEWSSRELAHLYAEVCARLSHAQRTDEAFAALTQTAVAVIPGAQHASITRRRRPDHYETLGATSDVPVRVDAIQYALGSGPCVDAIGRQTVFRTGDLRSDTRWPEFGHRAFAESGVLSMLSHRLFLDDDDQAVGLNIYATTVDAFDESSETIGTLLATHGSLAVKAATARERIVQLETALTSNRDIGVAMGVLMNQHKVSRDEAFDLLRVASQHTHRKLSSIALEVGETGSLALPTAGDVDGRPR